MVVIAALVEGENAGCEFDALYFDVESEDDQTPADGLQYAVYFAESPELLTEVEAPELILASTDAFGGEVNFTLGWSGDHRRDGLNFRREGTFCFALSAMDLAGNIGERSVPVCLNTTDVDDPLVTLAGHDPACSGLFCQLTPGLGRAPGTLWFIAAALIMRRRRRRSQPSSEERAITNA